MGQRKELIVSKAGVEYQFSLLIHWSGQNSNLLENIDSQILAWVKYQ